MLSLNCHCTHISKESLVVDEEGRLRGGQARRCEKEIIQGEDCALNGGSFETLM